jgi:hypothetical protein
MRRGLRIVVAAAGTALSLGLAGCVSIPDSGGVGQASGVGVADRTQQIVTVAQGPLPGADPESLVYGFFNAMLAYPRDVDVAREFLTPQAAGSWDPDAGVTIYDDSPRVVQHGGGHEVTVTSHPYGSLDARGSWAPSRAAASGAQAATVSSHSGQHVDVLRLRQVDGEWRIAKLPDGVFVSDDYFIRYYQAFSLYFFDPSRSILTPDPVYLAVGDTAPTALVKDLLQGPTADLRGAVNTAAPAGLQLDVSVSVSQSGLAVVPLSSDLFNDTDRQLFAAQLAWTLRQLPEVKRIEISVNGSTLPIQDSTAVFDVDSFAAYDPAGLAGERRLFALGDRGLVTVSTSTGVEGVRGPIGRLEGGSSVAVQASGQSAAIVSRNRTSVSVGPVAAGTAADSGGVEVWLRRSSQILRPSWDVQDTLWLVTGAPGAQQILVMTDAGAATQVKADWLPDWLASHRIDAFSVSRDGVRFAAIVRGPDDVRRLEIATIVRQSRPNGRVSLNPPQVVRNGATTLVGLRDLAWVSPTSLAVLAQEPDAPVQTYEVAIDGSSIDAAGGFLARGVVPTAIAAGPNTDAPIAIATERGTIAVQTLDLEWKTISASRGQDLYAPAYPG